LMKVNVGGDLLDYPNFVPGVQTGV